MQYFSVIARHGDEFGKTCAMLQATTLEAAAQKASAIIHGEHLRYVPKTAQFFVRRASRRETAMLQAYLSSCTGANLRNYRREDLDSLFVRRSSLLLSFFMALYLDKEKLRQKLSTGDESEPGQTSPDTTGQNGGSGGSGGTELAVPIHQEAGSEETEALPHEHSSGDEDEIQVDIEGIEEGDEPVGDGNQLDAFAAILSGGGGDDRSSDDDPLNLD